MSIIFSVLLFLLVLFAAGQDIISQFGTITSQLYVSLGGVNISCYSAVDCYSLCLASEQCISANVHCSAPANCVCEMFSHIAESPDDLVSAEEGHYYIKPGNFTLSSLYLDKTNGNLMEKLDIPFSLLKRLRFSCESCAA